MCIITCSIEDHAAEIIGPVTGKDGKQYRAIISEDQSPDAPDWECAVPVLSLTHDGLAAIVTGNDSWRHDGLRSDACDALHYFAHQFGRAQGVDVFSRYLAAFYGGSAETIVESRGWREDDYVSYVTRDMATYWGIPQDAPIPEANNPDWVAYCKGEVYFITIQLSDDGETWEDADSTGGYYGGLYGTDPFTITEARSLLESHAGVEVSE